jgi:hypothetical protein
MQQRRLSDNPSGLELWTAPYTNQTQRTLVNAAGGVKAYRSLTVPTRPYIKSVTPAFGETGVTVSTPITATFANLGTNLPVMKLNGQAVSYTRSTNGSDVTITHTPAAPFPKAELVTVEVGYGNASSTWYFVTTAIYKALYVAGGTGTKGDRINALRLASVYKLDVTFVSDADAANAAKGTNLATGKDLILFSSSAAAGANPIINRGFHLLPIPIINWEQAYRDDLRMEDSGSGGGGVNSQTQVRIVGAGHPLAAGFPNGDLPVATATYTFQQTTPPAQAILIATTLGSSTEGLLWGLTNGATCNPPAGPFTHPARRVFMGWAGDTGSEWWNANGKALFDATINWVMPPRLSIAPATAGNVTLSWTGDGVLQESATLAAGSWTDSSNQTNPQTRPATGTKFFRMRQ